MVAEDVDEDDYGEIYADVCGRIDCSDISVNGTSGDYGDYSFCSHRDKLSFVLNLYYHDQNENSNACDFNGSASINRDAESTSSCGVGSSRRSQGTATSTTSNSQSTTSGSRSNTNKANNSHIPNMSNFKLVTYVSLVTAIVGGVSFIL